MQPLAESAAAISLQSALIAAGVSLLVAVLGQLGLARRDNRERHYQRRRTALLEVQQAALALRDALTEYGLVVRVAVADRTTDLIGAERAFDRAAGTLEVMLSRVEDADVVSLVVAWRRIAQVSFISVHDEVTPPDEQRAWAAVNEAISVALSRQ